MMIRVVRIVIINGLLVRKRSLGVLRMFLWASLGPLAFLALEVIYIISLDENVYGGRIRLLMG